MYVTPEKKKVSTEFTNESNLSLSINITKHGVTISTIPFKHLEFETDFLKLTVKIWIRYTETQTWTKMTFENSVPSKLYILKAFLAVRITKPYLMRHSFPGL